MLTKKLWRWSIGLNDGGTLYVFRAVTTRQGKREPQPISVDGRIAGLFRRWV